MNLAAEQVAVAVCNVGNDQLHAGVAYMDSGNLNLLHFAWHYRVKWCAFDHNLYCWVMPELNPEDGRSIAAHCRRLAAKAPRVPYALRYDRGSFFSHDDEFVPNGNCKGLTCATFVRALFNTYALDPIDDSTWKQRCDDSDWGRRIVQALTRTMLGLPEGVEKDELAQHIEEVKNEVGCCRFRPEDVAAACHLPMPAKFQEIFPVAQYIKAQII